MTAGYIYRMYDAEGTVIYIGQSVNPLLRASNHRGDKPWWHEVRTILIEFHDDVLAAEQAAIEAENPQYNTIHTGKVHARYAVWRQLRDEAHTRGEMCEHPICGKCRDRRFRLRKARLRTRTYHRQGMDDATIVQRLRSHVPNVLVSIEQVREWVDEIYR
jgi:hypothetical protein